MPAFEINNKKAKKIKQQDFINEKELHELIDNNLKEIFGLIKPFTLRMMSTEIPYFWLIENKESPGLTV